MHKQQKNNYVHTYVCLITFIVVQEQLMLTPSTVSDAGNYMFHSQESLENYPLEDVPIVWVNMTIDILTLGTWG